MLNTNDFPSSFFFNFFCIHGVVILSISVGTFSDNLIELSSIGSGVNFIGLSVDDATAASGIHFTSSEKIMTAKISTLSSNNDTASDSNVTRSLDISTEHILSNLSGQTTSRLRITDSIDAAKERISSQKISSVETSTFTQTTPHDAVENAISEELYDVFHVNPSSESLFSKKVDARNITLQPKYTQNTASLNESFNDYTTIAEPLASVENQLEKNANTSATDPTSIAGNLITFEITLLNYTGEELNEKSFSYVNIDNQSYQPMYYHEVDQPLNNETIVDDPSEISVGSQHQNRTYLIDSSQIGRPHVAIEKVTLPPETSNVGTHVNKNVSRNVALTLKIKNWFYKLIIDEAISIGEMSNSLKDLFAEKDRLNIIQRNETANTNIATETLGSHRNVSEMTVLNENRKNTTNITEAYNTTNEANFSTELPPNNAYNKKNNDDHNTSSTTLRPIQMTPSYESSADANFINFPDIILENEKLIVNDKSNLNKLQNSDNDSAHSLLDEKNHLITASPTESSQDITNLSLQQALNTTETKEITLPSHTESTSFGEVTTEGRIFWNLCFTKRPTFHSISKFEPSETPTSNTLLMTRGSSNTKVFWNLCPTKKPNFTTEIHQPAPTTTYSSVFLESLPDYLTSTTSSPTPLSNVLDEELTSTTTEDIDTTFAVPATEETTQSTETPEDLFPVYWNVPTFQCHKYGINFSQVNAWGLRQNYHDEFRGQEIAILYDPGEFPALLPAPGDRRVPRNGGVPQEGSLSRHLQLFEGHLDKLIPNTNFSGLAIIDFEHWRPVWRQNWGSLSPYREFSRLIEKRRHPFWFSTMVEVEATYRFELGARVFLLDTLRAGKRLRPRASWGYYGYPFCFNYTPHNNRATCSYEVQLDNDSMFWLFSENTAYYPSLYLKNNDMYPSKRRRFIKGRLDEAMRVAQDVPVYPYIWYKYHDNDQFLSKDDMVNLLKMPMDNGCKGVVMWGASRDVNSRDKCNALLTYLEEVIGPAVRELHSESFSGTEEDSQSEETNLEEEQETSDLDEDVEEKKRNYNIRDFEV